MKNSMKAIVKLQDEGKMILFKEFDKEHLETVKEIYQEEDHHDMSSQNRHLIPAFAPAFNDLRQ